MLKYIQLKEIVFTGKQHIKWNEVEEYLKRFAGLSFTVKEYKDVLHINSLFANEFAESQYIKRLRGSLAKVKANIIQILPELIENAGKTRWNCFTATIVVRINDQGLFL